MSDLDNQEPKIVESTTGNVEVEVYTRPTHPGTVPKLQGPFEFDLNPEDEQDDEVELKDIYVIGEKADVSDLMFGEEEELEMGDDDQNGLSLNIICLLSTSGQVKICLDIEGVEAQWLPPRLKTRSNLFASAPKSSSLLTFQTFDTVKPVEVVADSWPMFSEDVTSRYSFYVTHSGGITLVSLASWVFRLESELQGDSEAGAGFRIDLLAKSAGTERERIYTHSNSQAALAAATAIRDPDLGHFVLSATSNDPVALFFDTPEVEVEARESSLALPEPTEPWQSEVGWEPRPLFHPSEALERRSALPTWMEHLRTGRRRTLMPQEMRLSMATLEVFTEGHKVITNEVLEVNSAVAELFRKCEALQVELGEQIKKVNEAKKRIDRITGDDSADDEPVSENSLVQGRLQAARQRQEELASRMEGLKRRIGRTTRRDLSDKEKAWADEVRKLESSILRSEADQASSSTPEPWKRFEDLKALRDALLSEAEKLQRAEEGADQGSPTSPLPGLKIPVEIRKQKMAQVIGLLDRETALVEAVKARVERLSLG
jgi:nucleoporin NUP82